MTDISIVNNEVGSNSNSNAVYNNYKIALASILKDIFFYYTKNQVLSSLNIASWEDFFKNKMNFVIDKMVELKANPKYLHIAKDRLTKEYVKFPPNTLQLIDLFVVNHDYANLFLKHQNEALKIKDYLDNLYIVDKNKLCGFSYTLMHCLREKYNINICSEVWCNKVCGHVLINFKDVESQFIDIFDYVNSLEKKDYAEIPAPITKIENKLTKEELANKHGNIVNILQSIIKNFTR